MTREEAIAILKTPIHCADKGDEKEMREALDMAIKALSQEPCDDAISRERALEPYKDLNDDDVISVWMIKKNINELPSVTQKSGKWIEHNHNGMHYIECSKCSSWFLRMYLTRNSYCPNCGARMVEPQESEDKE